MSAEWDPYRRGPRPDTRPTRDESSTAYLDDPHPRIMAALAVVLAVTAIVGLVVAASVGGARRAAECTAAGGTMVTTGDYLFVASGVYVAAEECAP